MTVKSSSYQISSLNISLTLLIIELKLNLSFKQFSVINTVTDHSISIRLK